MIFTMSAQGLALLVTKGSSALLFKNIIFCPALVEASHAAKVTAHDNVISAKMLIQMEHNKDGAVKLRGNILDSKPKYVVDAISVKVDDDFEALELGHPAFHSPMIHFDGYTKRNISEFTRQRKVELIERRILGKDYNRVSFDQGKYKAANGAEILNRCRSPPAGPPGHRQSYEKFKYCVRCEKVCYCSKEYQTEDWKYDKQVCEIQPNDVEELSLEYDEITKL